MGHIYGFHRKDGSEREENDFYATHPSAIPPLLDLLGWQNGGKVIWENSAGMGHLVEPLRAAGHTVIASDLIDRGMGAICPHDFLQPSWLDSQRFDGIIMNPPYKLALPFVEKSLQIAPVVAAFLRLSWLESDTRRPFFQKYPMHTVAVFSDRVQSAKNAEFKVWKNGKLKDISGAVAYAWFIWQRGHKEAPRIVWI